MNNFRLSNKAYRWSRFEIDSEKGRQTTLVIGQVRLEHVMPASNAEGIQRRGTLLRLWSRVFLLCCFCFFRLIVVTDILGWIILRSLDNTLRIWDNVHSRIILFGFGRILCWLLRLRAGSGYLKDDKQSLEIAIVR